VANVRRKESYPLRSTMTPLEYLTGALFEYGPDDANMAAFTKGMSIIGDRDTVEEFLACGIWPLRVKCEFGVERKETPLLKVVVPMSNVTPIIGKQELKAAFETRIVAATCLLVGNYCASEHNTYMGF
jgi:hypothetical protein